MMPYCDGFGRADVSEPPPRHGERFGEAAYNDGAFSHAVQRGYGAEFHAVVDQLAVYLIREDDEVVLLDDGDEGFEVALFHYCAGGAPVGLLGKATRMAFVRGVMAFFISSRLSLNSSSMKHFTLTGVAPVRETRGA